MRQAIESDALCRRAIQVREEKVGVTIVEPQKKHQIPVVIQGSVNK